MSEVWQPVLDALDALDDGAAVIDGAGRLVRANERWAHLVPEPRSGSDDVALPTDRLEVCRTGPAVQDGLRSVLAGGGPLSWESDGGSSRLVISGLEHDGERFALLLHRALPEDGTRFQHLTDLTGTALVELDRHGHALFLSEPWLRMRGLDDAQQDLGARWIEGIDPVDRVVFEPALRQCLADRSPLHLDVRVLDGSGLRWVRVRGRAHTDGSGELLGYVLGCVDVTNERADRADLQHAAHHDYLTGLPNRAAFLEAMDVHADDGGSAVLFVDLDDFKAVNDTAGHSAGDAVLRTVAGRLRRTLRPGDLAARFGGDEFVLRLLHVTSPEAAAAAAERLRSAISQPCTVAGLQHVVTATIGVVMDEGTTDPQALLDAGDEAMLRAKAQGKDQWVLADPGQVAQGIRSLRDREHEPSHVGHEVTVYDDGDALLASIERVAHASLAQGGGVLVVATAEHRAALLAALRRSGTDVDALTASGQLLCLDAEWTLGRFLLDGAPSVDGFRTVVGSLVHDMVVRWPRVSVYGEMVALLWAAGDRVAALTLEDMWNDLAAEMPFHLLCGYPSGGAGEACGDHVGLDAVLARHDGRAA